MKSKFISVVCLLGCIALTSCGGNKPGANTPSELDGYQLLWHDEFDGKTLNEEIWTKELRNPGWTNSELQEYTDSEDNIYVADGNLVLKAVKTQTDAGKDYYTSGKVNSKNKADFMYGKVIVRAKVPEGQGLWPAAWMMPTRESYYGNWPKCGEIDVMEVLGDQTDSGPRTRHGILHHPLRRTSRPAARETRVGRRFFCR